MNPQLLVDASSIAEMSCSRRYQFRCVMGLGGGSPYMDAGSAFHRYVESSARGEVADIVAALTEFSVPQNLMAPIIMAAGIFDNTVKDTLPPIAQDNQAVDIIEWKFLADYKPLVPTANTDKFDIKLCGTIDRADLPGQSLRILDWKTARDYKYQDVLASYNMKLQVYFYLYCVKHYLIHYLPENLQDLIAANRFFGQICGVFLSHTPPRFELSSPMSLSNQLEAHIANMIESSVRRAADIASSNILQPPEGMCYGLCDKCTFNSICVAKDDDRILAIIDNMPKKPYNPMTFR